MSRFLQLIAALIAGTAAWAAGDPPAGRPPNIIVVLSDDVGLSRIGCYGGAPFKTPHLDQLAATGLRFERCYSMPICGPSRSALLSGKYPFRTGATSNSSSAIDPEKNPTIANVLRGAGYATCAIGKLGQSAPEDDVRAPRRLGFDESMLWMGRGTSDRYWSPRYIRNEQVVQGGPDEYGPDLTHDFLVDFMARHREKPFFVYYSAVLTHGPLGTIRGAPMIGRKGEATEGGVREPLIAHCPGLVPAGAVCPDLTDFTDFFPTLIELAGVKPPGGLQLDGRSLAPQILGRPGRPREWVHAQHRGDYFIADHRYKLYGDGRFVDIGDSPIAEKPVSEGDEAAAKAKERLAAALTELRAGAPEAAPANPTAKKAVVPDSKANGGAVEGAGVQ